MTQIKYFKIRDKRGDGTKLTRNICVVNGQPFYTSSGEQSGMEDVWLPFEGFAPPVQQHSGMIQKPEIAHAG